MALGLFNRSTTTKASFSASSCLFRRIPITGARNRIGSRGICALARLWLGIRPNGVGRVFRLG